MSILLDLNRPVESAAAAPWEDAIPDTVMVTAARRGTSPAGTDSDPAEPPPGHISITDDDADITWEDAEWR